MDEKECGKCHEMKDQALEFFGRSGKYWDSYCRECRKLLRQEYYAKNKARVDRQHQEKYGNTPKKKNRPCVICGADRGTNHARCDSCVFLGRPLPGTKPYNGQVGVIIQGGI